LHSQIVVPLKVVSVLKAKAWIDELFWEHFNCENIIATREAAFELNINCFAVAVLKNHISHFKAVWYFFWFLPSFYVSVKFTIFCYRVPPELTPTTRLLAFFEFYPLFLLVFWQLHRFNIVNPP